MHLKNYIKKLHPILDGALNFNSLQEVQNEGQKNESKSDPLGHLGELCVHGLGLGLEGIAVAAAADSTAETGTLTGLEHDDNDETEACDKLNDGEYEFDGFH